MIDVPKLAKLAVRNSAKAEKRIKEERLIPYLNNFDNYRIFPYLSDLYDFRDRIESQAWFYEDIIEDGVSEQSDYSRVENAQNVISFLKDLQEDVEGNVIPVGEAKRDELENKFAVSEYGYDRPVEQSGWMIVNNDCYQQASLDGHRVFRYQLGHVNHANPQYFHDMITDRTSALTPEMDPVAARKHLIDKNLITDTGKFFVVQPKSDQYITHSLQHAVRGTAEYMIFQRIKCF